MKSMLIKRGKGRSRLVDDLARCLLATMLMLLAGSKVVAEVPRADSFYAMALQYEESAQYVQAIDALNQAVELEPDNTLYHFERGKVYFLQGDVERAIADLDVAIRLDPDHAPSYAIRGTAYDESGDTESALADLGRAIELAPSDAVLLRNRAVVRIRRQELELALPDLDRAIELDPQYAMAYLTRCQIRAALGDFEGWTSDYSTALRIAPAGQLSRLLEGIGIRERMAPIDPDVEVLPQFVGFEIVAALHAVPPDKCSQAVDVLKAAARSGTPELQALLGMSKMGDWCGLAPDFKAAAKWLRTAADQGDAYGQYNLGHLYEKGLGVRRNKRKAFSLYRDAADQGHRSAQFNTALFFQKGIGTRKDSNEAIKYYRAAAAQGHERAILSLALLHGETRWLVEAAQSGDADTQLALGHFYKKGWGVEQDSAQAAEWYRRSAEQCLPSAQYSLGAAYESGEGVPQDDEKAIGWYRRAAQQGDPRAQACLSDMLLDGRGTSRDPGEAYVWIERAIKGLPADSETREDAVKSRREISKKLTQVQIVEAERVAGAWEPTPER